MNTKHRIQIASLPDREKLVSEILFDDIQWAEINQERDALEVEFYPRPDGGPWRIDYEAAINALHEAKQRLIGK